MLQDKIKVLYKRRRHNKSRYSANKIYVSRAELKHSNTKLLIILYTYNKQKSLIEGFMRKLITLTTIKQTFGKFNPKSSDEVKYITTHRNRFIHTLKNKIFIFKK